MAVGYGQTPAAARAAAMPPQGILARLQQGVPRPVGAPPPQVQPYGLAIQPPLQQPYGMTIPANIPYSMPAFNPPDLGNIPSQPQPVVAGMIKNSSRLPGDHAVLPESAWSSPYRGPNAVSPGGGLGPNGGAGRGYGGGGGGGW